MGDAVAGDLEQCVPEGQEDVRVEAVLAPGRLERDPLVQRLGRVPDDAPERGEQFRRGQEPEPPDPVARPVEVVARAVEAGAQGPAVLPQRRPRLGRP